MGGLALAYSSLMFLPRAERSSAISTHSPVDPERHTPEGALRGKSGVSHLLLFEVSVSVSSTDFLIWDHEPAWSGSNKPCLELSSEFECPFQVLMALDIDIDMMLQAAGVWTCAWLDPI